MSGDWPSVRLGDVSEIDTGGTPSRSRPEYWNGSVRWMASGEIHQRRVRSTAEMITEVGLANSNAKIFQAGTVMVALNGQGKTRGRTAILEVAAACNQSLAALTARQDTIVQGYLFHVMDSGYEALRGLTGDGRSGLNLGLLHGYRFPLPPLPEQRVVVAVLDAIDDAIERADGVIARAETLRQALLHELLTRGVPGWHTAWKEVPGIGSVPACWIVEALGNLATVTSGATPKAGDRRYYVGGTIPFARINDVTRADGLLEQTELSITPAALSETSARLYPANTVLVTMYGTIGTVARTARPMAANQAIAAFLRSQLSPAFLEHVLRFQGKTLARQAGKTTQANITVEIVQRHKVALPANSREHEVIAATMQVVEDGIATARNHRSHLADAKSAIGTSLLTGGLRVPKALVVAQLT